MHTLFELFSMATCTPLPLLQRAHDRRTEGAVLSPVSNLPPNSGALQLPLLDQGVAERDLLWYGSFSAPRQNRGITPKDGDDSLLGTLMTVCPPSSPPGES